VPGGLNSGSRIRLFVARVTGRGTTLALSLASDALDAECLGRDRRRGVKTSLFNLRALDKSHSCPNPKRRRSALYSCSSYLFFSVLGLEDGMVRVQVAPATRFT
jgi:hypothetical protein